MVNIYLMMVLILLVNKEKIYIFYFFGVVCLGFFVGFLLDLGGINVIENIKKKS